MAGCLADRPGDVEGEQDGKRNEEPSTEAPPREDLTRSTEDEHRRNNPGDHDPGDVPTTPEPDTTLPPVRPTVVEPLTKNAPKPADRPWKTATVGSCHSLTPSARRARFTSGSQKPPSYSERVRTSSSRR